MRILQAFALSPDERRILYTQIDQSGSDVIIADYSSQTGGAGRVRGAARVRDRSAASPQIRRLLKQFVDVEGNGPMDNRLRRHHSLPK